MSLRFHWFLPTSGDGRAIIGRGHSLPLGSSGNALSTASATNGSRVTGAAAADRPPSLEYLGQIARSPRPAPGARTPGWRPRR
jgi:alkanesulfonate monooxygenase